MWRTTRILVVVLPLLVALNVRAEDQSGQTLETPSAETPAETTPNRQVPQEPGPAPGAAPVTDLVGYKPIPNSMLPVDVAPGTPAPTAHPTNIPVQSNLGGAVMMPMGPYTLGRDDVVHIAVQGQPEFTSTYVIGPDGSIQYGFLGDVKADGLTKEQLRDVLVERLKKFQRSFTSVTDTKPQKSIDLCDYAKYLLKEGSGTEKRELLLCIKSKLILTQGVVNLEN